MDHFKFDTEAFTASVKDAIKPEMEKVKVVLAKQEAIARKTEDNAMELASLENEKAQGFKVNDLLAESADSYKAMMDHHATLENKLQAAVTFGDALTKAAADVKHELENAQKALTDKFCSAITPHIARARLPIAEAIESILDADGSFKKTVLGLHTQIRQDSGVITWDFSLVPSDLYPRPSRKDGLRAMIQECKEDYSIFVNDGVNMLDQ